jgi:hypothetical protein
MAETTTLAPLTRDERRELRPTRDEDVLQQMRERFKLAQEAEADERRSHEDAMAFRSGAQWPDHLMRQRQAPGSERPCLVIDRLSQYINQVINAYRRAPLGLRVRPKSGGATQELATILEGHLRDIEQQSEAEIVYTTALDQAVGHGLGYWRLVTEYETPTSFQQVPRLKAIYNSLSVYMDPAAVHPAALDASWAFVTERWATSRFCQQWEVRPQQVEAWTGPVDYTWNTGAEVLLCEYFYKTWKAETLVRLPNGTVLPTAGIGNLDPTWPTRQTLKATVHYVKAVGYAILERATWSGQYIPIIRCEGQRLLRDGRAQRTGLVQAAADSQRMYNYFASAEAEAVALAPKAPYILYAEQIDGYQDLWDQANDAQMPYLPIKAHVEGGSLLPPPQRQVTEPAIQAISQARLLAAQDMQATVGQYEASVGQRSNEQSGTAINARKIEGEQTNYTFPGNLAWSIRACGIQILDLLPVLYSGPMTLRQVGQDGSISTTKVNQPVQGPDGQTAEHRLAQGDYDVVVSSGPSYETSRMQVNDNLTTMLAGVPPEVSRYFMDVWAQTLDFPGSQELAQRLKTLVPPEALAASEQVKPETKVVQLQNQLQQVGTQFQALQQQMQQDKATQEAAIQQVKLLEQQVATMQTRLADKQQENQLDAQKNAWAHEVDLLKLRLEEQKMLMQAQQFQQQQAAAAFSNGSTEEPD